MAVWVAESGGYEHYIYFVAASLEVAEAEIRLDTGDERSPLTLTLWKDGDKCHYKLGEFDISSHEVVQAHGESDQPKSYLDQIVAIVKAL